MFKGNSVIARLSVAAAMAIIGTGFAADAKQGSILDLSSNGVSWVNANNRDMLPPASGPGPVTFDPRHPYVGSGRGQQATFRIADVTNPILKPWAAERMKKYNDEILLNGKSEYTARATCRPAGTPGVFSHVLMPQFFIQTEKQVWIIYGGNTEVRRVYLNVPHTKNPKPSWYGESVGHYEGDTLIVDTIAQDARTFVDNYRTPHTEQLHVVETYRLIEGGKTLEVNIQVDDPGAFNMPWSAVQRYARSNAGPLEEDPCAENNASWETPNNVGLNTPVADKPDF